MTSISSLSSNSSTSSLYGTRNSNIISGLASGMDTESMIEGMVQGYQQKITSLQQNRTLLQWQQNAYQSISNKLVEFSRKYMSFNSSTNLLSSSFFSNSVITTTNGKYADMVTASGKSHSNIILNGVAQLASAARYTASAVGLNSSSIDSQTHKITVSGNQDLNVNADMKISQLEGSLTLKYGGKDVTIEFGELEFVDSSGNGSETVSAEDLKNAILKKLKQQTIVTSSGESISADSVIDVQVSETGEISFLDKSGADNAVSISEATGKLKETLGLAAVIEKNGNSFRVPPNSNFTETIKTGEYLAGKTLQVTLDGVTKTITLPDGAAATNQKFVETLNEELSKAFGTGKLTASLEKGKLSFTAKESSTFSVASDVGSAMGIGDNLTSYLDTGRTLKELGNFNPSDGSLTIGGVKITGQLKDAVPADERVTQDDGTFTDRNGNKLDAEGYYLDDDGNRLYEYSMQMNGEEIGPFTQETEFNTILNAINNSSAGVNVTYSDTTNQFLFEAVQTGENGQIHITGELGTALFGSEETQKQEMKLGCDAVFQATVNGKTMTFTRSSNSFEIDGMGITLNGIFNNDPSATETAMKDGRITNEEVNDSLFVKDGEGVTFSSKMDSDKIVDTVKKMVEEFNTMMKEVKDAYSTMPLQQSNGSKYKPLTDEDKADMSEDAIKEYEEKAKTGILFMDQDLNGLYRDLRNAIAPGGSDGAFLRSIGIETSYEEGLSTITFNEEKFRAALESNPDGVADAFVKSKENGASTNGLMTSIQEITDKYAATTGSRKGILIEKAGSQYSPTAALDNELLKKMEDIDDQIAKWQAKMSDKVDYYTNKFTQLEVLIQQMNSQSASLSGLLGS